jgi:hypothetical protein
MMPVRRKPVRLPVSPSICSHSREASIMIGKLRLVAAKLADPAPVARGLLARHPALLDHEHGQTRTPEIKRAHDPDHAGADNDHINPGRQRIGKRHGGLAGDRR